MTTSHLTRPGPAIVTRGLTRHFTRKKTTVEAVRGLDLEIGRGELVAFLGPNGAGKSTTLRMLTTLIAPNVRHRAGRGVRRRPRPARRPPTHRLRRIHLLSLVERCYQSLCCVLFLPAFFCLFC